MLEAGTENSLTSYDPELAKRATPKLVSFGIIESIIHKLLTEVDGVEAIIGSQERAYHRSTKEAKDAGLSSSLPIQTAGQPPQPPMVAGKGAQVCIKTGYIKNGEKMVSKVAAGGGDFTANSGVVFVFDQKSLRLSSILCDEGILTEVRTAAACAYASRLLLGAKKEKIRKLGIIGGGVQAVWQLRLLQASVLEKSCRNVVVKTRTEASAKTFIQRMKNSTYLPDREWDFEIYQPKYKSGKGFTECELIHTLTPSREPVLVIDDLCIPDETNGKFLHISAVGADSPGKTELDPQIIRKADKLVCDSIPQSKQRGEFQSCESCQSLIEIGSLTSASVDTDLNFTIFDSSGVPLQDVEMANLISKYTD